MIWYLIEGEVSDGGLERGWLWKVNRLVNKLIIISLDINLKNFDF